MSSDSHIAALQKSHDALDRDIAEQERRPNSDPHQVQKLKQEKLRLKDVISKARQKAGG